MTETTIMRPGCKCSVTLDRLSAHVTILTHDPHVAAMAKVLLPPAEARALAAALLAHADAIDPPDSNDDTEVVGYYAPSPGTGKLWWRERHLAVEWAKGEGCAVYEMHRGAIVADHRAPRQCEWAKGDAGSRCWRNTHDAGWHVALDSHNDLITWPPDRFRGADEPFSAIVAAVHDRDARRTASTTNTVRRQIDTG